MIRDALRALWAEPRAPDPPARVWRDWALLAVVLVSTLVEGFLRPDLLWRPAAVLLGVAMAFTVLWRRTHPLATTVVGFGTAVAASLVALAFEPGQEFGLGSMAFLLVLPYALYRWGSGREVVLGSAVVLAAYASGIATAYTGVGDALGAFLAVSLPAAVGASVRFLASSRTRELDRVRLREREQLARELHDTVAHHVSAMVVRAQAGRVVGATDPDAAFEALELIEGEGSRTLAEMRSLVGTLRAGQPPELAPQHGIGDIAGLAVSGKGPRVDVVTAGDVDSLPPTIQSAVYRIAQESLTNARRHARHATAVVVRVCGDEDAVRVSVHDDGEPVPGARPAAGYGIVGMTERAAALGGTLVAGPAAGRGWVVEAVLPRPRATR